MARRAGRGIVMVLGAAAAVLLGVQAVRLAAVRGLASDRLADAVWPSYPARVVARELTVIGTAAGRGQEPAEQTIANIRQVALRDPLASDPYLVAGTAALAHGERNRGTRLLGIALDHDPRSPGARLLLATQALQDGRLSDAMIHISALSRIVPGGGAPFGPALATFARQPSGAAQLAPLLTRDPSLRGAVLEALAEDADNAPLVMQLAGRPALPQRGAALPEYQTRLVTSLVKAGQFDEARRLWARFTGNALSAGMLSDPGFAASPQLPPFGWTLMSGAEGSAEADGLGGLQVIYYGRNDATLAGQWTVLPPGTYRLSVEANGGNGGEQAGESLAWTVTCAGGKSPIGRLALRGSGRRILATTFAVPNRCPAQNVDLVGRSPDFPGTVALSLRALSLRKVSS